MTTFFMLGRYSVDSIKEITAERTKEAVELLTHYGGKVREMYALLGPYDLVLITELPSTQEAMKASIALTKLTGISFTSCPALTVEHFDQLASEA